MMRAVTPPLLPGIRVDEYGKGEDDILGNTVEFPNMSLGKLQNM